MNQFLHNTWKFNEIGGTPVEDSYDNLVDAMGLVREEYKESFDAINAYEIASKTTCKKTRDSLKVGILKEVIDLQVTAIGVLYRMGLNRHQVEAAMGVISENNLSKFSDTEEDAAISVESFIDSNRYSNVQYESVGDKFVVHGITEDGARKILKDWKYKKCEDKLLDLVKL